MLPFSHTVPPHQQDSNVMIVGYNGKSCKMQTVSEEEYLGKHKINREEKNKNTGGY